MWLSPKGVLSFLHLVYGVCSVWMAGWILILQSLTWLTFASNTDKIFHVRNISRVSLSVNIFCDFLYTSWKIWAWTKLTDVSKSTLFLASCIYICALFQVRNASINFHYLIAPGEDVNTYRAKCTQMADADDQWADHIAIVAVANHLGRDIMVISPQDVGHQFYWICCLSDTQPFTSEPWSCQGNAV